MDIGGIYTKKFGAIIGMLILIFSSTTALALPPSIEDISIDPDLNLSFFGVYNVTTEIFGAGAVLPILNISTINGEGGEYWNYYVNGTGYREYTELEMRNIGGNFYSVDVYLDYIYPEIFFTTSNITWNNVPEEMSIYKNQYHIFNFSNPFEVDTNMSFFIEFNVEPNKPSTPQPSLDIQTYLIGNGEDISYFETDWRNKPNTVLVGTHNRQSSPHHVHSPNSSHYLVPLSADENGFISGLNISDNFWVVLFCPSPNTNRGWNLRYHPPELDDNSDNWFLGDAQGWTTAHQNGAPDVHIHLARNESITDMVNATVTIGEIPDMDSDYKLFSFGDLPNLPPNAPAFDYNENFIGTMNVSWSNATDPNNDEVTYTVWVEDMLGNVVVVLMEDGTDTWVEWDTTEYPDGNYDIVLVVSDGEYEVTVRYSEEYGRAYVNNIGDLFTRTTTPATTTPTDSNDNATILPITNNLCIMPLLFILIVTVSAYLYIVYKPKKRLRWKK